MEAVRQQQVSLLMGTVVSPGSPGQTAQLFTSQPPQLESVTAWKFTSEDGWTLSLEPGAATLSVGSAYTTVQDFAERWNAILRALQGPAGHVSRCDRIGVRYLDLIELGPTPDPSWASWLKPEITGWLGSNMIGSDSDVYFSITQSQLSARPFGPFAHLRYDVTGLVRHGLVPPGTAMPFEPLSQPLTLDSKTFLIDLDLFVEGHQPFVAEGLVSQFRALHSQIDSFFRWSLTPEGEEHFGVVRA